MALKTSKYMILALVRAGVKSGYALRRFSERQRMEVFSATNFSHIYPDLAELEEAGYLSHRNDPHGARQRRAYELTPKGERALMSWLRRSRIPQIEVRDEGMMRLVFADHLPREDAIELVARLRARAEEAEREFREEIVPRGEELLAGGLRFPVEVCRLGAGFYGWAAQHLTELEATLRAEQDANR